MKHLMKSICFRTGSKFSQMFLFTILIHTFAKNKANRLSTFDLVYSFSRIYKIHKIAIFANPQNCLDGHFICEDSIRWSSMI